MRFAMLEQHRTRPRADAGGKDRKAQSRPSALDQTDTGKAGRGGKADCRLGQRFMAQRVRQRIDESRDQRHGRIPSGQQPRQRTICRLRPIRAPGSKRVGQLANLRQSPPAGQHRIDVRLRSTLAPQPFNRGMDVHRLSSRQPVRSPLRAA